MCLTSVFRAEPVSFFARHTHRLLLLAHWPASLLRSLAAFGAVLACVFVWAAISEDGALVALATQRYGSSGGVAIREWRSLVASLRGQSDAEQLRRVNDFANRRIRFAEDLTVWQKVDYWASPLESLGRGLGDCEDYVIAKYFTLRELGIPTAKLRLIYVRARIGGPHSSITQAHMVLGYYVTPQAIPLVLDNLLGEIRPAATMIVAGLVNPAMKIEIEVTAFRG